jgi:outer membrane protein TolC
LNLVAFPFYQDPPTATVPHTGWQAQLVLTLPLYDGGLRYGLEHERKALAEEARVNVEATLRQARSDVRTAFEELERADLALDQARQSEAFAKKALELANLAYRAGATTNLEVIDAERQARDAQTRAAIAEDAARQASPRRARGERPFSLTWAKLLAAAAWYLPVPTRLEEP